MAQANRTHAIAPVDCRAIWGKFLLALRENKEFSLHALCVELGDYFVENDTFVVYVGKKISFDSLKKLQNVKKMNDIFASLNMGLKIDIRYQQNTETDKIRLLSQVLGVEVKNKE